MTSRTAPGTPKLVIDGEPEQAGEPLSDSTWEGLEDDDLEQQTTQNLAKIANARRRPRGTGRTQG